MYSAGNIDRDSSNITMQSMHRGMQMLELLAVRPMRAKELADATGTKWATAHRTLSYLRENGFAGRDDSTGLHYVGRRLFSIGNAYLRDHPLFNTSEPLTRNSADKINCFVQIAEREGDASVVIASAEPRTPIPSISFAHSFMPRPLHAGARGLVLLAFCPEDFTERYLGSPLRSLTERTITDPDALREKLAQIISDGYATSDRDVTTTSAAIAAPIKNSTGDVVASVSIFNYRDRVLDRDLILHEILGLSRSLSQLIGWRAD